MAVPRAAVRGPAILPGHGTPGGSVAGPPTGRSVRVAPTAAVPVRASAGFPSPFERPAAALMTEVPIRAAGDDLVMRAQTAQAWVDGNARVRILRGDVELATSAARWRGRQAVCWETPVPGGYRLDVFFDGRSQEVREGRAGVERGRVLRLVSAKPLALIGVRHSLEEPAGEDRSSAGQRWPAQ